MEGKRKTFDSNRGREKLSPCDLSESMWSEILNEFSGSVYSGLLENIRVNGFVCISGMEMGRILPGVNIQLRLKGFGKYRIKPEKRGLRSHDVLRKVILVEI